MRGFGTKHHDNISMFFMPPYTPLLYSKTGVYRGIQYFFYFCFKTYIVGTRLNRLNEAVLTFTHNIYFERKYEFSKKNQLKIVIFTAVKIRCILHGRVFVMETMGL